MNNYYIYGITNCRPMSHERQVKSAAQQPVPPQRGGKSLPAVPVLQQKTQAPLPSATVVQRMPEDWENDDVIVRALALERSGIKEGSSTWEKVKTAIRRYKLLGAADLREMYRHEDHVNTIFTARTDRLNTIKQHLATWIIDHPVRMWNGQKVKDIRAIIPELQTKVLHEEESIVIEKFFNRHLNERPAMAVPAELSAGVATAVGADAKAQRLLQNFNNNFRFRYIGFGLPGDVGLAAHQGDCGTLANIYIYVATQLGIVATRGERAGRQLVASAPIKGRNTLGNTHDGGAWYFDRHFWAIVNGTDYDVLFMQTPPPAAVLTNGNVAYKGVTYYTFADGRCVIEPTDKDKFNDPAMITGQGRVFASVLDTTNFIDANVRA